MPDHKGLAVHWKFKAAIQNTVSHLPSSVSYSAYFWIQRHFGGLRKIEPISRLNAGIETWRRIIALGYDPSDKVFFEVGTGRVPLVPLAYWLMGANRTVTIDTNPYLKAELIRETLQHISEHSEDIFSLFGPLLRNDRMEDLLRFHRTSPFSVHAFLDLCHIEYIAPGNAASTSLPSRSIDFHTSFTVLEHIPPDVLKRILNEGNRIMNDDGLFIHKIDYSDHFSHSDKSITSINFLQYSDNEWARYADNRYMYMNRLRHDDYIKLFQFAGHHILAVEPETDEPSLQLLRRGGFKLDDRFKGKPQDVLAITGAWISSRKCS